MGSFVRCFRMWNALKTGCVPEQISLKLVPINSRVSSMFSQCNLCYCCQMTPSLVSTCAVYISHVQVCCICSPVLYVPLDSVSKNLFRQTIGCISDREVAIFYKTVSLFNIFAATLHIWKLFFHLQAGDSELWWEGPTLIMESISVWYAIQSLLKSRSMPNILWCVSSEQLGIMWNGHRNLNNVVHC
jgi:hypothetical protein